jgi:hypothetical protein
MLLMPSAITKSHYAACSYVHCCNGECYNVVCHKAECVGAKLRHHPVPLKARVTRTRTIL